MTSILRSRALRTRCAARRVVAPHAYRSPFLSTFPLSLAPRPVPAPHYPPAFLLWSDLTERALGLPTQHTRPPRARACLPFCQLYLLFHSYAVDSWFTSRAHSLEQALARARAANALGTGPRLPDNPSPRENLFSFGNNPSIKRSKVSFSTSYVFIFFNLDKYLILCTILF